MIKLDTGDFGARLRRLREQRGMSLRDIANRTKISVAHLEALERNDVRRLPGGIFLRGIIRSYAIEVGADPEATLRDFLAVYSDDSAIEVVTPRTDYEKATRPQKSRRPLAILLLLLIVVAALAWSLVFLK